MTENRNAQAAGGRRWARDYKHMGNVLLHCNTLDVSNVGLTAGGAFWPTIGTERRNSYVAVPAPDSSGFFAPGIRPVHNPIHGFYAGRAANKIPVRREYARRLHTVSTLPAPTILVGAHLSGGRRHG